MSHTIYSQFRNNIQKKNIDIYSIDDGFNSNEISDFKLPFEKFPKTNVSNFDKELYNRKKHINNLLLNTLVPNDFVSKIKRRNSLTRKHFIDSPFFRKLIFKSIEKEKNFSSNKTFDKISFGKLTYFSMKNYGPDNRKEIIKDEKKIKILNNSKFFTIEKGEMVSNYISYRNSTINNNTDSESSFDFKKKFNKSKNNSKYMSQLKLNNFNSIDCINKKPIQTYSNDKKIKLRPESVKNLFNKKEIKKFEKNYFKKADQLRKNIKKMNKTLFHISDKAIYKKKKEKTVDYVLETILDKKIKKKKSFGTKQLYLKSSQNKDILNNMDSNKKDLLKLSDIVKNMNDENINKYSDKMEENYYKKQLKLNLGYGEIPEIIKKKQERQRKNIILRMEKFDLKVRRLLYNVDEEKIKLYKNFQKVLFKKK